jgi:peptidoglycan-associated lipoprotein
MHKNFRVVGSVSLLLLVAACGGKKKLAELPPPPQSNVAETTDAGPSGLAGGNVGSTSVRSAQEEFAAQTGTDRVLFDTDAFVLDQEARTILTAHARWLAQHPGISAIIEGHCDERGTREYNLALGERRAASMRWEKSSTAVSSFRFPALSPNV